MRVGAELRQARERAGLSSEQIAERTKIQLYKIEALENDNFERLPDGIYLDGVVRAYAHEVATHPDPLTPAATRSSPPPASQDTAVSTAPATIVPPRDTTSTAPQERTTAEAPESAKTALAADSLKDVSGSWTLATHITSSSFARFEGLQLGYEIQLEQAGDRVRGAGRKVTQNGDGIGPRAQTPISLDGTIDGDRLTLTFNERGARRPTQGKFVLLVDEAGTLRGRFSSTAAHSSGTVEGHRLSR